jgi:hypothetical protein
MKRGPARRGRGAALAYQSAGWPCSSFSRSKVMPTFSLTRVEARLAERVGDDARVAERVEPRGRGGA